MSLRTRLILSYALIIVLCLSIVALALTLLLQNTRDRQAMARLGDVTTPIFIQVRALVRNDATLNQVWAHLEEQARATRTFIFLLDDEGTIIRKAVPRQIAIDFPSNLTLEDKPDVVLKPFNGTFHVSTGQKFVYVAYPLRGVFGNENAKIDTLVMAVSVQYALAFWASMIRLLLWAGLIALGISVVIAIFLARSVYRPVQQVTAAAGAISRGNYTQEIPVSGTSEVKELTIRFNQMAKEIKRSHQMLRDFIADVSHELRSPLTSIKGFAQAIVDGTASDDGAKQKAAHVIEDESTRMMRLVDELLLFSRLESGQITMVKEPVDVKELIQQVYDIYVLRAEENKLAFTVDVAASPVVMGDIDRLEQVLNNLLDNAFKHTPEGGAVSITVEPPSGRAMEIRVNDTGPGIPSEQLANIFERFYRAENAVTKAGSGLGLAIAREIVRAHGGTIEVESVLEQGTTFTVKLPVVDTEAG